MIKQFKQWIIKSNVHNGTFTKLIKSNNSFLIKQCDGMDIETIVITEEDIHRIIQLIDENKGE